jgi:hypothetical protein
LQPAEHECHQVVEDEDDVDDVVDESVGEAMNTGATGATADSGPTDAEREEFYRDMGERRENL